MQTRTRWIAPALVLMSGLAYNTGRGEQALDTGDGRQVKSIRAVQEGWVTHQDPMGFAVQVPMGWNVSGDRSSGRVALRSRDGVEISVWPLFLPGAHMQSKTAVAALRTRAMRLAPKIEWGEPAAMGTAAVRLPGRDPGRTVFVSLVWRNSSAGAAAFVYLTSAPANRYHALEETFARILVSFRAVGAPAGRQGQQNLPSLQYVRWLDPRENAFTLEVPSSWRMEGGMARNHALEFAPVLDLTSPDGRIWISVGNPNLTGFTTPLPGYPEGSWYPLTQTGGRLLVRRYLDGTAFAADHVRSTVGRRCALLELPVSRDREDIVRATNEIFMQYGRLGIIRRMTAGEVTFSCRQDGQSRRGYHFATTQIVSRDGTSGVWNVTALYGYVAAGEEESRAQEALMRLVRSFAFTPTWLRMQGNVNDAAGDIIRKTNERISQLISQSFQSRQRTLDEMSARRSAATLEVEDLKDPVTGDPIRVESGSNYYWVDQRGKIVGTETDIQPGIDFRQLLRP